MDTPYLSTERLILEPINQNDIDFIYELFRRSETNKYSEYNDLQSIVEAEKMFNEYLKPGNPTHFRVKITLKEINRPIGTIGLYKYSTTHKRAEIGYDLLREYWGNGYATEAVKELLRYGFYDLDLVRVEATVDSENIASIKVLEGCSFCLEGKQRKKYFYKGSWHDELFYGILREEFKENPNLTVL